MTKLIENCPDCSARIGEQHIDWCDVERCPCCGDQYISCDCECDPAQEDRVKWTGLWPGVAECRELGWYSKMVAGKGWVTCDKTEAGATEDLNRLAIDCKWDKDKQKYILD